MRVIMLVCIKIQVFREEDPKKIVSQHIKLLQDYNEAKDKAQVTHNLSQFGGITNNYAVERTIGFNRTRKSKKSPKPNPSVSWHIT